VGEQRQPLRLLLALSAEAIDELQREARWRGMRPTVYLKHLLALGRQEQVRTQATGEAVSDRSNRMPDGAQLDR
jgi:hypothetical protein